MRERCRKFGREPSALVHSFDTVIKTLFTCTTTYGQINLWGGSGHGATVLGTTPLPTRIKSRVRGALGRSFLQSGRRTIRFYELPLLLLRFDRVNNRDIAVIGHSRAATANDRF